MKRNIVIVFFFISCSIYSQNSLNDILDTIYKSKKEIRIKKCKRGKYILNKDKFCDIKNKSYVTEIYAQNSKKSFYSLVRLGNYKEYDLYTVISNNILDVKKNFVVPNSFSFFLIYDKNLKKLIYINSSTSIGSVSCEGKEIILTYSISFLKSSIYLINDDFMPISSLRCFKDESGLNKYFLSIYDHQDNLFIEKTNVKDNYIYDDSKLIPFEDLIFILNLIPNVYNYQKECSDSNCFSEITKIALEKR
jgi:hypothetical protein